MEEYDPVELLSESPCTDAKLFEVISSSCALGSKLVSEACSVRLPIGLIERECAVVQDQLSTVTCLPSSVLDDVRMDFLCRVGDLTSSK